MFVRGHCSQRTENMRLACPFCRLPIPNTMEEVNQNLMKRAAANDPVALFESGWRARGNGDHEGALKYWTKAAELGDASAHYELSNMYEEGLGVEKDEAKELYHLE